MNNDKYELTFYFLKSFHSSKCRLKGSHDEVSFETVLLLHCDLPVIDLDLENCKRFNRCRKLAIN